MNQPSLTRRDSLVSSGDSCFGPDSAEVARDDQVWLLARSPEQTEGEDRPTEASTDTAPPSGPRRRRRDRDLGSLRNDLLR